MRYLRLRDWGYKSSKWETQDSVQVLDLQVQGQWPHPLNTFLRVSRSDFYFFTEHDLQSTTSVFPRISICLESPALCKIVCVNATQPPDVTQTSLLEGLVQCLSQDDSSVLCDFLIIFSSITDFIKDYMKLFPRYLWLYFFLYHINMYLRSESRLISKFWFPP